ncbi:PREDICTED: uncharacterized protein LOC101304124 [Fragaria vesca subsp. vesca]|uniref:uncharacterized protein LOC101304124 n=1 Tax=Fragaria vesca subsp. vesca TaxID=101020 RepID=UPI0002C32BE8|nr:PREDICTED: uncharacterized protein LOC101304124 [Fragaria vesca subsp. vesca]XP_011458813.1 PREDICTED: uncharacterized protein LOC101304124 [Fragaria vesca subsp. vesca]
MAGGFLARKKKRAEKIRQVEISKAYEERERKKGPGSDPLLYICTFEEYKRHGTAGFSAGYGVHTIRVSDLNGSDDKPRPEKLREVANLQGEHLPLHMGFAVFGSRIVLAGGWFLHPKIKHPMPTYVLETDPTEEPNPSFISTTSSSRPRYMIPQLKGHKKSQIWLREIDGKLYALSGTDSKQMIFQVFDPKAKPEWDRLPAPPFDDWSAFYYFSSCVVVGTKIILTTKKEREFKTLCFDVAHPKGWTSLEAPCSDPLCVSPEFYNPVLVLDVKEDQNGFDKLMFTFDNGDNQILVSRMKLSDEGVPVSVESVAELDLPDNRDIEPTSYNFAHLGDQTVCFAFMDIFTLHVITFNFTYAPFSHKFLGHMFNKFNSREELSWINISGCFVL